MLTDQQIEAAARKLCELRGIDPDYVFGKRITEWNPVTRTAIEDVLNWQNLACEIRDADQVREAIASVTQGRS